MESWFPGSRRCGKFDTFFYSFFNPSLTTRCVTDTRWWSSWTACWWCAGSRGSAGPTVTPTTPGLRHRVSYNRWGKNGRLLQKNSQSLQNETRNLRWKPFFCNFLALFYLQCYPESEVQQQQCGGQDDGDRGLPAQPGDHVHHGGLDPQEGLEEGGPPLTRWRTGLYCNHIHFEWKISFEQVFLLNSKMKDEHFNHIQPLGSNLFIIKK